MSVQLNILSFCIQLHASVFSFMLALSGMGVIAIMFTNKLYLIVKKGSGTNDSTGENK